MTYRRVEPLHIPYDSAASRALTFVPAPARENPQGRRTVLMIEVGVWRFTLRLVSTSHSVLDLCVDPGGWVNYIVSDELPRIVKTVDEAVEAVRRYCDEGMSMDKLIVHWREVTRQMEQQYAATDPELTFGVRAYEFVYSVNRIVDDDAFQVAAALWHNAEWTGTRAELVATAYAIAGKPAPTPTPE